MNRERDELDEAKENLMGLKRARKQDSQQAKEQSRWSNERMNEVYESREENKR